MQKKMDLLTRQYKTVSQVSGPLIFVEAVKNIIYGAMVEIQPPDGEPRSGQEIEVSDEYAVIQVFEETTGIDCQAIDGKPVYLVLLLAVPAATFAEHIKTLAGIARLLNNEAFREKLMNSETPQEIMEYIQEEEGKEFFQNFSAN